MDSKLLKEAAEAHHKALNGMDSKLVATQADYTAVNAALGKSDCVGPEQSGDGCV